MSLFSSWNKPDIEPPKDMEGPDYSDLLEIFDRHRQVASSLAKKEIGGVTSWVEISKALVNVVNIQLSGIRYFLENHFYQHDKQKKELYQKRIHQYSNFAASTSWVVGREWGRRDPALRKKMWKRNCFPLDALSPKAIELLELSIFDIYSYFYYPHKFFYESRYGRRTRGQRDDHMRDTYQSMMIAAMICFLSGIKSWNLKND